VTILKRVQPGKLCDMLVEEKGDYTIMGATTKTVRLAVARQ
jgi:hypothetical protein